ncbi:OprO/OprP family phosphate-selective porin [Allohahella sp. A8]|uniref:OprO/OprP family phosphate-selective porin n=1 Tax=Allohahella sp. A8 TaxID=3141461 RepID=UPI003A806101
MTVELVQAGLLGSAPLALSLALMVAAQPVAATPQFDFSGYVAAGIDHFDGFYSRDSDPRTTRVVLRSAKLELEAKWGTGWAAEIDGNYEVRRGEEEADIGDAYLQYRGVGRFTTRLGRFKEPFGLERLASYGSVATSERSLATSAFAPGRSEGLLVGQYRKRWTWALGLFTRKPEGESTRAVTGRLTMAPMRGEQRVLHLGLAASWRDLADAQFQVRERGEVFSAETIIRSVRMEASDSILLGIEAAWISGRLSLTSEAIAEDVTRSNGEHWRFNGAYVQAAFFVTDDHRGYSRGELDRVKPAAGFGAVEVVARYSAVDLRDKGLGAEASVGLLGLNYYLGEHVQLRLNWLLPQISGSTLTPEESGEAFTLRTLFLF